MLLILRQCSQFFNVFTAQKMKLRIWSHLLKKSLMENFIFCAVFQVFCGYFWNCMGTLAQNGPAARNNGNTRTMCDIYLTLTIKIQQ